MPSFGIRVFLVVEYVIDAGVRSHFENSKFRKSDTKAVVTSRLANWRPMHDLGPEKEEETN